MMAKITSRETDYSQWYLDIITQAKLADYGPVKGTMVIRPNGYAIWENMQRELDRMFKESGHVNAYFPIFIPESFIAKEKQHVEGFSPELAVVTHAGGKDLEENMVVRPTSETVIWHMYKKWIKSYRDLPLLYNQWANVVRWEMRTRLFLRTTEFLWQEGHTAHATDKEAIIETEKILYIYKQFVEEFMAIPVIHGRKTKNERFAGAVDTLCIEAMMQDKKALQAGTSHFLGQNFAKAFDVKYQDENGDWEYVWATSWGVSTRLVGALIMGHSDDNGLIVPPKLAAIQVVIVPISKKDTDNQALMDFSKSLYNSLNQSGIRVHLDDRDQYSPGWKFSEWELLGVPIRIEIGPREMENNECVVVRRDLERGEDGQKESMKSDDISSTLKDLLDRIQLNLYNKAKDRLETNTYTIDTYKEFSKSIEKKGGFYRLHWCGSDKCEEAFKDRNKATIRCIPLENEKEDGQCIVCGEQSHERVIVAKAY
ncbi:MAG: proline--tRNA ligase [Calditrichaeota bacterium]|nr:proline--tRNA ligase [Calditrichota bacterium]